MLYNKRFVKNPIRPNGKSASILRCHNPFNLEKDFLVEIEKVFHRFGNHRPLETLAALTHTVHDLVEHEDHAENGRIRTAVGVRQEKKGHCLEQVAFLWNLAQRFLSKHRHKMHLLIAKNPTGYECENSLDKLGYHPFIRYEGNKEDILFDPVSGKNKTFVEEGFALATQEMSYREFIAFYIQMGAEDLHIYGEEKDTPSAINFLEASIRIDPNNYTTHLSLANILAWKGDRSYAEINFRKAEEIAPNLADVGLEYGSFLLGGANGSYSRGMNKLRSASKMDSDDAQTYHRLEDIFEREGDKKFRRISRLQKEKLMNSPKLKKYFFC